VRITINDAPDNYPTQDAFGRDVVTMQKKPYIHSKYFVIDDRYTYIGSMNLSTNAMDNNREIGIVLVAKRVK
jgi:phosphatidylserine/phosphatidylglycerophosphate/cardiolipin synthase-like enzyme